MALPDDRGKSASFYEELRIALQNLIDDGGLDATAALSVAMTSIRSYRDDQ